MRKLFLIPLMAMLCTVMAWGATITVGDGGTYPATDAGLNQAIAAASAGDVIELTSNIAYATNNNGIININKSITLDGKGYAIFGYGKTAVKIDGTSEVWPTSLAVNASVFGATPSLQVKIQNLTLGNIINDKWTEDLYKSAVNSGDRYFGLSVFDGVDSLALENVRILIGAQTYNASTKAVTYPGISWGMMFWVSGTNSSPLRLSMEDCEINSYGKHYSAYILKPIKAHLSHSTINGYCGLYFKYRASGAYGDVVGSRGSVVNADACIFDCQNSFKGASNNFAIFPLEDDGITLNLHNCSLNAETLGDTYQRFLNLQYLTRADGFQPVNVKITGDNTHLYNVTADKVVFNGFTVGQKDPAISEGTCSRVDVAINFTIEAGTFTFNPSNVHWYTYSDNKTAVKPGTSYDDQSAGSGAITFDNTKYQVNEVNQGGKIVYRVVKRAAVNPETSTLYDLNDAVETATEGENPVTSFELSTGGDMTLNNEVTTAGYVQVKDNGTDGTTVTVGQTTSGDDQTLVINNGLDVQGNSQVIVEPGATLQIGEGGIVTSKPENIVIEADENGAASMIMDPAITVNTMPNLTVKMKAKIGQYAADDYQWHRFALPVEELVNAWTNDHGIGTYLFGWNYSNNDWAALSSSTQMQPWLGYTMTTDEVSANTEVEYTFKGNLVGNTNANIDFTAEGYNFFGNSYTGYIDVLTLVEGLVDEHIDGTVWMWNPDGQNYGSVSLNRLRNKTDLEPWESEVAPMQTFILRIVGSNTANETVNYASAIWGNPRYGIVPTTAPARMSSNIDDTFMKIIVTAASGLSDRVDFTEDENLSDAYDKNYDGSKYMSERHFNLYSTINGENYNSVATDNIVGKTLTLQTLNEINYTLSFRNVRGNQYAIKDNLTNVTTIIADNVTYDFVAQPNSTIEGRFVIVPIQNMPTDVETVETTATVKGIYTIMGQYVGEDFESLPAGVYVVDGVKVVK